LVHVTGDRIGDALIKWPIIVALKKALVNYRLVWLAGLRGSVFNGPLAPLAAGVIDEVRDVAGVGVSWREFMHPPPAGTFDIVIATEPKLRSALLLRRITHQIFISPVLNFRLSDRKPAVPYPTSVYEQMRLLATLAVGRELEVDPVIRIDAEISALARALLPASGVYIGFAPGAARSRKRWPLTRFIELANAQKKVGRTPVFFLGPIESSLRGALAMAVPGALFPEQSPLADGRGGPLLSIALAARTALGVANDAGGGHLLAAGGRPLITLFGHTSEHKFKPPYGPRIAITAREYGGTEMTRIPVERVAEAIEAALRTSV